MSKSVKRPSIYTLVIWAWAPVLIMHCMPAANAHAQSPTIRYGSEVPADVELIYERGLSYLARSQKDNGSSSQQYPIAVTSLALMAFPACGEDPNFGQYSINIQRSLRFLIQSQNAKTGFIGDGRGHGSMYSHGFAMMALAESYGVVDETLLWVNGAAAQGARSIGEALELAVRCAVTSQKKNTKGGWRYGPGATDADTSVSGSVLMGLLAARNAGIEVPDESIDKALAYYRSCTGNNGSVSYTGGGGGGSINLAAIGSLVYAVAKKKDWKEYAATRNYITQQIGQQPGHYVFYYRYYMSQALFQADYDAWSKWNRENIRILKETQQDNGSFVSDHGPGYGTAMGLLSIALNYRLLPIYER